MKIKYQNAIIAFCVLYFVLYLFSQFSHKETYLEYFQLIDIIKILAFMFIAVTIVKLDTPIILLCVIAPLFYMHLMLSERFPSNLEISRLSANTVGVTTIVITIYALIVEYVKKEFAIKTLFLSLGSIIFALFHILNINITSHLYFQNALFLSCFLIWFVGIVMPQKDNTETND